MSERHKGSAPVVPTAPVPVVTETPKVTANAVNTPAVIAAREALVVLLGPSARHRNDGAIANAAAKLAYGALNVVDVAKHYATLAREIFLALPKLGKQARLWANAWQFQTGQIAIDIFADLYGDGEMTEEQEDSAAKLRARLGGDASKYSLTFYWLRETVDAWANGLYGAQPAKFPTLAQAWKEAKLRKALDKPKGKDAMSKIWGNLADNKLPTLAEMETFAEFVARDIAARKLLLEGTKETAAPVIVKTA